MTLDEKNRWRFRVRMTGLAQWLVVMAMAMVGWMIGKDINALSGILAASTTGMTTLIGLDYFSKPTDTKVDK